MFDRIDNKWLRVGAYVLLAAIGLIALTAVSQRVGLVDERQTDRNQELCHSQNETREAVRLTFNDLVGLALGSGDDSETDLPPEEIQRRQEQTEQFLAQFNESLEARLGELDCTEGEA